MKNASALLVLLLVAAPAMAKAAGDEDSVIVGPGTQTCADWTGFRAEHEDAVDLGLLGWVQGFLSGLNAHSHADGGELAGIPGPDALLEAMDGYCKAHPTAHVYEAASALYVELQ